MKFKAKIHPGTWDLITDLYDNHILGYEELAELLDCSPSRVQQIVLTTRKRRSLVGVSASVDASPSGEQDEDNGPSAA